MSTAAPLLDLSLVVDRLQSITDLNFVGLTGGLVQAREMTRTLPVAWVVPTSDNAVRQPATKERRRNEVSFQVMVGARNFGDAVAGRAQDTLRELRSQIINQLEGWHPGDAVDRVKWTGGQILLLDQQVLWYGDNFSIRLYW